MNWTSPARTQYGLRVMADTGCQYRLRVSPADALTTESPGIVAEFLGTDDSDVVQRIFLDGQLMGEGRGGDGAVGVGHPGPAYRSPSNAQNMSGSYAWGVKITDVEGRGATTIFTEDRTNDCCASEGRVGVVRRVVITPSGGILSSCGELFAPLTCFPRDGDGDGVEDNADQCKTTAGVAPTGCPDADRDGVPDASDKCAERRGPRTEWLPGQAARVGLGDPQTPRQHLQRPRQQRAGQDASARGASCSGWSGRERGLRQRDHPLRRHVLDPPVQDGSAGSVYIALAATSNTTLICEKTASKRIRG